jgi:hypothetical protein
MGRDRLDPHAVRAEFDIEDPGQVDGAALLVAWAAMPPDGSSPEPVIAGLPVGLYAEQISRAGQQQRNFLPALTQPALISAALNLDRALGA